MGHDELDAELAWLEKDIADAEREAAELDAVDMHCSRCGRDCSDGECWINGDPPRVAYCIACITPDERRTVADAYRKFARKASALAAEHGDADFERDEADRMRRKAEHIERDDD